MDSRTKIWSKIDWVTILIYIVLAIAGWFNIYSASYDEEHRSIFDISQRYGKQLIWIILAFVIAFCIMLVDSKFFVSFAYVFYGFFILLLIAVLFLGREINASKSWFIIGNFAIQPAEFAKFGTALAVSKLIGSFNFRFTDRKKLFAVMLLVFLPVLFIFLQNDIGSMLVYFVLLIPFFREGLSGLVLFFILLFGVIFILSLIVKPLTVLLFLISLAFLVFLIIRRKTKEFLLSLGFWVVVSLLVFLVSFIILARRPGLFEVLIVSSVLTAIILLIIAKLKRIAHAPLIASLFLISIFFSLSGDFAFDNMLAPHHRARINILLGNDTDPLGAGYNVNQSKIAIGSGGLTGKGFLNGTQTKFNFVPEQSTDFIFCTVGEEWGFIGSLLVIAAFLFLMIRIIMLAEKQRSVFSRVYGYCTASIIFFHFAVNVGMTIGLVPVIGIPLPFFSYGGSSLWFLRSFCSFSFG
jgi:rod shape determining protein RodA